MEMKSRPLDKFSKFSQNPFKSTEINMNGTWKHSLELSIDFCQVLCDFYEVFVTNLWFFAQTLQKHIQIHKDLEQKKCLGFVLGTIEGLINRGFS